MEKAIEVSDISGDSVYGIAQVEYIVDGKSGLNFADAIAIASFKVATAIEDSTSAYSAVITARQKKIDQLGEVLACFDDANANLPTKNKSTDKVDIKRFTFVKSVVDYYGIAIKGLSSTMVRGDVQKALTEVQYQIDKEDNLLQQDMVSMQSFVSKRDNAFSTASKIIRKTNNAASATIANIGG